MTSVKLVLLWISAGVLVVSLGLLSTVSADRQAAAASPAMSAASGSVAQPQAEPNQSRAPSGDLQCQADASGLSLTPSAPQDAICGTGFTWTCCPCGGCGCRNQHMSPANFCAC